MDSFPQHPAANFASNLSNIPAKVSVNSLDPSLRLDSHDLSCFYFSNSKGSKRKWSSPDRSVNLQDGSSPVLGLGHSSRSCTTSAKEIEEDSSNDLGLSINLRLQNERTSKHENYSCGTPEGLEVEKMKLDLELSLSTGHADSVITTITEGFHPFQNDVESAVIVRAAQLVEEGSTSSRWKARHLGPPGPPLHTFDHAHSHINRSSNLSSATVTTPKSSDGFASAATHQQQRCSTGGKTCQFTGCTRGARGASGLCIAHGGGRRCQRSGCHKGAEGKTVFCKAHGGGRRCQHLGCVKSAEGQTEFCISHGGGRQCCHEGCTRASRGKSRLCIRHGGGKRCKMENCSKSAEGSSGLCISHGGGRRCRYPDCTKGAQGSTMLCKAHGGGKRCTFLGCTKGAEGSTPFCKGHGGGKRCSFEGGCTKSVHGGTLFCVNHGGGKRCAVPGCTKSARGRTSFCVRHGGGKRCKSEGCGKSAQGSTDFCKAHGGGKRCSWGQLGSEFGGQASVPCDKFARGKSGLCAAHSAEVQGQKIHGDSILVHTLHHDSHSSTFEKMKGNMHANAVKIADSVGASMSFVRYGHQLIPAQVPTQNNLSVGDMCLVDFSLPEGRVHGGNLMAMLRGAPSFSVSNPNQVFDGGKPYLMP